MHEPVKILIEGKEFDKFVRQFIIDHRSKDKWGEFSELVLKGLITDAVQTAMVEADRTGWMAIELTGTSINRITALEGMGDGVKTYGELVFTRRDTGQPERWIRVRMLSDLTTKARV